MSESAGGARQQSAGQPHPSEFNTLRTSKLIGIQESIDVAQYVDAAIDARRGAEVAGVIPQVDQLPIFGITKNALLAIRYRLEGGLVRSVPVNGDHTESNTHVSPAAFSFDCRLMLNAAGWWIL